MSKYLLKNVKNGTHAAASAARARLEHHRAVLRGQRAGFVE
jgi:hypothetical protein